jgi:asparagine synthase (glutamine-hydrolysing)
LDVLTMCGIAGWLGFLPDAREQAEQMTGALRHRGPDDAGVLALPGATLVHTRLSIIDLSNAGRQPIANEDASVWAIFNGEIYNHQQIRRDLQGRGHRFKGHSDGEVIPHLYEEAGASFVERLQGMFALALYDTRSRTLLLARDKFGIKPLFYSAMPDRLAFSSELNALLDFPGVDLQPDRQALNDFAALLFIPAPQTFYTGIRSLEPGEALEARLIRDRVSATKRRYHTWRISVDRRLKAADGIDRAEYFVDQAVRRQLESDVPLGALLSGGIDSSLVSSAAQAALNGGLRTFNVRFPEAQYDETWAAVAVAEHIESQHRTLDMSTAPGTWDSVSALLLHAGQPFADTSLFAAHAICRLMRGHVTVALSGDGGDEGFGGYDSFRHLERLLQYRSLPGPARTGIRVALGPLSALSIVPERLPGRILQLGDADDESIMQSLFCWVRDEEHRALCREERLPVRRWFQARWDRDISPRSSALERLSAHATEIHTRLVLANDYLFKVDTASMRESLEVRVPMLDEDLFAFGLSLPHACKVNGRSCKRVLRGVANRWLPHDVARKPKWGFGIPVDTWVDAEFKHRLAETLLGPSSTLGEYFRPEVYRPLVQAFCEGRSCPEVSRQGLYQRAVMLLSAHLHLERVRSLPAS